MTKKFFITIIFILILFCLGWLGYEKFLAKEPNQEIIARCIAALCTTIPLEIIFHFKVLFTPETSYDATYISYKYGWLVDKNFIKNKKLRLKVFSLLEDYDLEKYKRVLKKKEKLELLCDCHADKTALDLIQGMCYTAAKAPDKALPHLLSMVNKNPINATAWALISINHLNQNDLPNARAALSTALRYDTENQWFYFCATILLFKLKEYSAATEYGQKAEELGCVAGMLYLIIAVCYKTMDMDEQYAVYMQKYHGITDYEETMDPRPHLFNRRRRLHRKYLKTL